MHNCLQGMYDLHVHSGPDIVPRKIDDVDLCKRFIEAGFKGYCIKSHYFCTAERARTLNQIYPELNVVGAISLNKTVGGLNPQAVDAAGRDGAKLVWMPTSDARNEIEFTFGENCTYDTMPAWALRMKERRSQGIIDTGITVLKENGELTEDAKACLEIIGKREMILCTGHLSPKEIYAILREKDNLGLRKVIVTHATWASIALTKEQQLELAEMGAIIEQCSSNMKKPFGITWDGMYEVIRYVGAKHCILSSDCGNRNKPMPDESLETMADNLLANGFSEEEVRIMAVENTTGLIEG